MIKSHSIDWHLLRHAYGNADDIPALLEQIENFPNESDWQTEPWFSLWSALYHQGDIYSASIAAVPKIVSTLARSPEKATLSFYLLPTSIALADKANPIDVDPVIRNAFKASVETLGHIAADALPSMSNPDVTKAAQAAVFVSHGDYQKAEDLLEADT